MAKVEGPLFSLGARGKIADAMVFFPWKGIHVVRRWLKPTQPNSSAQGYVRTAMSAIGKEIKKILATGAGDALDSKLFTLIRDDAPAGLNWNAFHAQGFLNLCIVAGAFNTSVFTQYVEDYSTHAATTAWNALATSLGLADFAFGYGYTDTVPAGFQLYAGALAAYANEYVGTGEYILDPTTWAASDITSFYQDHTTA